ncbi:hypothetical protein RB628_26360 [Streptomyces sp. ADMS]|uniref:hypothetical protein n=1 Tax=Streptomyces sp. ADMS TaxID=3071415 RepID=UPI00296FB340|nr:hypothetical protein [Streptomyces sp. ADMS]MDW4908766.1 hypothetical protein [Streptomyces sp. ADMS]
MLRRLHGRGALFDTEPPGLAPRLIGLRPHHHIAAPLEHSRELPFVVLTGGRGLGKSAVLGELRAAYQGHTPIALIDCEDPQFTGSSSPPESRPAQAWSPIAQALLVIAEQLAEPVTGARRIAFPRLMSGLIAVAAGGWSNADTERIRWEVQRMLLLNESASWFNGFAARWAGRVAAKAVAAAISDDPLVATVIEATLESMTERSAGTRQRRASTWYRTYPNAGDRAELGLRLLSDHFRAGGTSREHAERYLVRALLADLTDAYAGMRAHLQRLGRPLVLVDNAQGSPGRELIEQVLRDRAEGIADQVAFIAAVRGSSGHSPLRNAVRRDLRETTQRTRWTPGDTVSSRALLVSLPPLSSDDTLHIVDAVCTAVTVPAELPPATHRLTCGNPLGIALLAESARQNLPQLPPTAPFGALLTAELALHEDRESHPAYRELLDRLVPADRLDELTVLAAAHDHDSACVLAAAQLPDDFGPSSIRALETRLVAEGLPDVPGQFVGDAFVRTLLLLRLHHRHADHGKWRDVHETLIQHYEGPEPSKARYRLHHELALGDTGPAVACLRDTFHTLDTRTWLDTLLFIASAPYFHAHDAEGHDFVGGDHQRARIAFGHTDAEQRPPDDVDAVLHLRVRRLLHAVWQLTDPLVLPDRRLCDRLRYELVQLSDDPRASNALLWQASQEWPEDALAGRPLRTPGGEDADDRNDGGA